MPLNGRQEEIKQLDRLLESKEAEFLALYGRRRVGKTFLIREHFKKQISFELTGLKDGLLKEQLTNFHHELNQRSRKQRVCPESWQKAFSVFLEKRNWVWNHWRSFWNQRIEVTVHISFCPFEAAPSGSTIWEVNTWELMMCGLPLAVSSGIWGTHFHFEFEFLSFEII